MNSRIQMNPRIQRLFNWAAVIIAIGLLIWEQTILISIWDFIIDSPYWIIDKVDLGWTLASAWLLALLPWRWIWYIPLKVFYRWVIEDIVLLMIKEKIVEHMFLDIKIYTTMKLRSFNKWVASVIALIGLIPVVGTFLMYGLKAAMALVKKVFMNTIFSKIKLFLFKYIPLILTYITSIFPFIGGIFELLFQMFAIDVIIGWIEKIWWIGPRVVKFARWIRGMIDTAAKVTRDWVYSYIGLTIENWAKQRGVAIRLRTMGLKTINNGESFEALLKRLDSEKEEKKKKKEEKRKTIGWKIQSYSGGVLITSYLVYFAWISYTVIYSV